LLDHGLDPADFNWAATLGSTRAVIEGVLAGLGGAFLSRSTVARELAGGTLAEIPLKGINVHRGLFVVRHNQRTLSPAASCFLEELLKSGPDIEAGIKMS
jgi:DNA-binding transcriptional LysR family regulator